jgi:hypothetical protein
MQSYCRPEIMEIEMERRDSEPPEQSSLRSAKRENEGRWIGSEPPNPGRSGAITKHSRERGPIKVRKYHDEFGKP